MKEGTCKGELISACANAGEASRTGLWSEVAGDLDIGVMSR